MAITSNEKTIQLDPGALAFVHLCGLLEGNMIFLYSYPEPWWMSHNPLEI